MLRHESEDMDLVEDPFWWMLRHESETWLLQRNAENLEIRNVQKMLSCEQFSCGLSRRLVLGG